MPNSSWQRRNCLCQSARSARVACPLPIVCSQKWGSAVAGSDSLQKNSGIRFVLPAQRSLDESRGFKIFPALVTRLTSRDSFLDATHMMPTGHQTVLQSVKHSWALATQNEEREQQQNSGHKLQETEREMRMDAEAEPAPEKIYGINGPPVRSYPVNRPKGAGLFLAAIPGWLRSAWVAGLWFCRKQN